MSFGIRNPASGPLTRDDLEAHGGRLGVRCTGEVSPEVRDAVAIIKCALGLLIERGFLRKEAVEQHPLNHLSVRRPISIDLEVVGDTTWQDEVRDEYREALRLFKLASDTYETIRPIEHANEYLFWRIALADEITTVTKLQAVVAQRDFLAVYASSNAIVAGIVQKLDQVIADTHDSVCRVMATRVADGKLTVEEGTPAVEMLKQSAASGAWRDPEGDLDRIEQRQAVGFA